jgi:hypothetical protein
MSVPSMLYGAALSAILALLTARMITREHRPAILATAAGAAFLMPLAWNTILRATGATPAFSHDLPFRPVPISWQDTGSGVFTLAGAMLALALATGAREPAPRLARLALGTAIATLLIDIYTY